MEPVRGGRIELRTLGRELLVELLGRPVAAAGADEGRAGVGKLLQPVFSAGVLPPSGGAFDSPSGKTFLPPMRSAPWVRRS